MAPEPPTAAVVLRTVLSSGRFPTVRLWATVRRLNFRCQDPQAGHGFTPGGTNSLHFVQGRVLATGSVNGCHPAYVTVML